MMQADDGLPGAATLNPRVASVTVAFNPGVERLARQLAALDGQVNDIVVVDNGSAPSVASLFARHAAEYPLLASPRIRVVPMDGNEGIARGLNVGIEAARARGAEFVVLLDHDSVPGAGMVAELVATRERCATLAIPVAAVGPRVKDLRDAREYPFVRLGWLRNRHQYCAGSAQQVFACDFLISSGTLIALEAFDAIGPFEDGLFIDSVDREWCFRALSRGFALYGACAAHLDHRLGDHRRPVMGGVELVVHSPARLYYMTRNRLLLYRRGYVPLKWKIKDFLRVIAKFAATVLLVAPRRAYVRHTGMAIRDALANRGGKLPGDAR
jgi:rhamnosyltransferase